MVGSGPHTSVTEYSGNIGSTFGLNGLSMGSRPARLVIEVPEVVVLPHDIGSFGIETQGRNR